MAIVDILIPSARGIREESRSALAAMIHVASTKGQHTIRMPLATGNSVVHWSRNKVISVAMYGAHSKQPADCYFLMDDDMVGQPEDLLRLLRYKNQKAIITGISTVRSDPPRPNIRRWNAETEQYDIIEKWDWDSNKLMEIDAVGAAFMVVPRLLLEEMAEAYLKCSFERLEDRRKFPRCDEVETYWDKKEKLRRAEFAKATAPGGDLRWASCYWFEFLRNLRDSQVFEQGEDVGFCWKAKRLGYKVLADPQVVPQHIGVYGYSVADHRGNYEDAVASGKIKEIHSLA